MSKIKRIFFSIAFMIFINFFIQTTSLAVVEASYSGENEIDKKVIIDNGEFSENIKLTSNNILKLNKFSIHNAKNHKKWGWNKNGKTYYWPRLDRDVGMLCLEHNLRSSEEAGVNDDVPILKWNIQVNGRRQRRNMTSRNGEYNNVDKGNTANSAKIAYILSKVSKQKPDGSNTIRKNNGAQGALWQAYMDGSYPQEFPGEELTSEDIKNWGTSAMGDWAESKKAKKIYNEAKKYNSYLNELQEFKFQKKDGFQWRLSGDGGSYIIGPFYATFNENDYADTSISLNTKGDWRVCDYNGNSINFTSGRTFYIKVAVGALNGSGTLTITQDRDNLVAEWWQMRCKSRDQLRIYISRVVKQRLRQKATISFSTPSLTITKVDADNTNKKLPGMQFKIRYGNNLWLASDPRSNNSMPTFSTNGNAVLTTDSNGQIVLPKVYDGTYTIVEVGVGDNWQYEVPKSPNNETTVKVNGSNGYATIKNRKTFIKLTGYVWVDRGNDGKETTRDNLYNNGTNDRYLNNVDIRLKHKTNASFNNEGRGTIATSTVRIDPDTKQYISYQFLVRRADLANLYIEFDYDGLQYQNVTPNITASNGSKAAEDSKRRDSFNANFSIIEGNGNDTGYTLDANGNKSQNLTYTKQNHNSILNNVTTTENSTTVTINNKGNYHIQSDTTVANYQFADPGGNVDAIQNVNFGVYERNQPDLAVVKDIENVRLAINGKNHVYNYNQRAEATNNEETSGFNVGVKFENSYKTKYRRPIYRADYEYTSDDKSKELQVYITYRIMIKNQSSVVETQANRIYEYYDKNYELVGVGKKLNADGSNIEEILDSSQYREDTSYSSNNNGYTKLIIEPDLGTIGTGQDKSVYVKLRLGREAVIDILNGRENLDNFVEIASYSSIKDGKPYAGVDIDSNPGNASPTNEETVEDDTDVSPTLLLEVANAREMEGTVFVDEALPPKEGTNTSGVMTGQVRQGDGIYNTGESTLSAVDIKFEEQVEEGKKGVTYETKTVEKTGTYKFKLQYYNADGDPIEERFERLYVNENNLTETNEEADFSSELPAGTRVVVTPEPVNGTENAEKIYTKELEKGEFFLVGYIPGDYTLTYTWGDETYTVQNYKGTIYDYNRYLENYVGVNGNEPNKNWYDVNSKIRYTDAIDNYTQDQEAPKGSRQQIDDEMKTITNGTTYTRNKMDSTTPVMNIEVEYEIDETKPIEGNTTEIADRYTNLVSNIDFGIIRRAKQDYVIEKRISSMKITLANGRTLADLQVVEENGKRVLKGTKTGATYMEPSLTQIPKNGMLRFEMDSEIIQGSQVQLTYEIVIRNTSEVDYVDKYFYEFGTQPTSDEDKQKNIVKITPSKIVDYLDSDWGFEVNKNKTYKWIAGISESILSEDVIKSEGYKNTQKLFTDYANTWKLDPLYNPKQSIDLNASKLLSSSQDIELDNEIEIVEITKTGGGDIEDDITPGNYKPAMDKEIIINEPDDDKAETLAITPNTGENKNYTLPIAITLTAFIVLIGGIIFIKKKILNK